MSGKVNGIGRTTLELLQALADIDNLPFEIELYSQNMKGIGGRNTGLHFECSHFYLPHREIWNVIQENRRMKNSQGAANGGSADHFLRFAAPF